MMGINPKLVPETDRANFYMDCNRHGIYYGPTFQPVEAYATDRTYARLRYPILSHLLCMSDRGWKP